MGVDPPKFAYPQQDDMVTLKKHATSALWFCMTVLPRSILDRCIICTRYVQKNQKDVSRNV